MSPRCGVEETIARLVAEGKCCCPTGSDCIAELRGYAVTHADVEVARRREKFFKALGDEKRQRIISLLAIRDMCVCELVVALETTQSTASHHLQVLENVGIVSTVKMGKWVFYHLREDAERSFLSVTI